MIEMTYGSGVSNKLILLPGIPDHHRQAADVPDVSRQYLTVQRSISKRSNLSILIYDARTNDSFYRPRYSFIKVQVYS